MQFIEVPHDGAVSSETRIGGLIALEPGRAARAIAESGVPTYTVMERGQASRAATNGSVRFTQSWRLDARLRGQELTERSRKKAATPQDDAVGDSRLPGTSDSDAAGRRPSGTPVHESADVMATLNDTPAWLQHGDGDARHDIVALSPPELDDGLALRHFLNERQFLRLLPLIHFLREVTSDLRWRPPPLRACFIFDDPNLHRESYGFLAYGAMAAHARRHGYHAAIATIPFDGWYASPRAVRTFAANRDHLSLLVHGNDHVQALLSRALLRIARLEKNRASRWRA